MTPRLGDFEVTVRPVRRGPGDVLRDVGRALLDAASVLGHGLRWLFKP